VTVRPVGDGRLTYQDPVLTRNHGLLGLDIAGLPRDA
jgi:hypothetical protein